MPDPARVTPQYAWDSIQSSADALLVCAYDDPAKCRDLMLQGAIDMTELKKKLPSLPKNREIILYCA